MNEVKWYLLRRFCRIIIINDKQWYGRGGKCGSVRNLILKYWMIVTSTETSNETSYNRVKPLQKACWGRLQYCNLTTTGVPPLSPETGISSNATRLWSSRSPTPKQLDLLYVLLIYFALHWNSYPYQFCRC